MIPIPAKYKGPIGVVLIGVIASLQALAKLNSAWSWITAVVQILTAVELYVTVPSGAQEQMRALRAAASKAAAVLVVVGSGAAFALGGVAIAQGCMPQQAAAIVPAAACVASVIADAIGGMTIAQIVAKEGPGCVADGEQVAAILLGSSEPKLVGTVALDEARMKRGLPALRK
jgi:hypothetical protein